MKYFYNHPGILFLIIWIAVVIVASSIIFLFMIFQPSPEIIGYVTIFLLCTFGISATIWFAIIGQLKGGNMGFGQKFCKNMSKRSYQNMVRSTYDLFPDPNKKKKKKKKEWDSIFK